MTPKEKAEELFNKYRPIIAGKQFVTGFVLMSEAKELTKRSAIIAVDEIIDLVKHIDVDSEDYWNEVKHEIEKL
jgi:hypothetical protein